MTGFASKRTMATDKFRVTITKGLWKNPWPEYFDNFYSYCKHRAKENKWNIQTAVNHELKPWGGRLIVTKTQGWYLRWDKESSHTMFVIKWS